LLSVSQLEHPHTAVVVASVLDKTLEEWAILANSVDGASMVKAIRLMQKCEAAAQKEGSNENNQ